MNIKKMYIVHVWVDLFWSMNKSHIREYYSTLYIGIACINEGVVILPIHVVSTLHVQTWESQQYHHRAIIPIKQMAAYTLQLQMMSWNL